MKDVNKNSCEFKYVSFWLAAKSSDLKEENWLPLTIHLEDTAGVMVWLWDRWLSQAERKIVCDSCDEQEIKRLCKFLGMTHDIGKATAVFQSRILEEKPEIKEHLRTHGLEICRVNKFTKNIPHALAGEYILREYGGCPRGIAAIVGAHHGKPQSGNVREAICKYDTSGLCNGRKNMWHGIWEWYIDRALKACCFDSKDDLPKGISTQAQIILSGLLIMADWIASNQHYFPLIDIDSYSIEKNNNDRLQKAMEYLKLPYTWEAGKFNIDEDLFYDCFGFEPNAVQKAVLEAASDMDNPGIWILEAQMGVGKTEAALSLAEIMAARFELGGLFFGLPTQATANGIFRRILDWARKQSENTKNAIELAHGEAEMNETYRIFEEESNVNSDESDSTKDSELTVHSWFNGRKRRLLANFVVGTVDQLLMAALKQKHVTLRHLALAGKVIIIDEVHAYDDYMNVYLDRVLNWLGSYGVPVIILSATLPPSRRSDLVKSYLNTKSGKKKEEEWEKTSTYPLLTWTNGSEVRQKPIKVDEEPREVLIFRISDGERLEKVKEMVAAGGCVGIIANTVKRSQEFAKEIKNSVQNAEVLLLHAGFLMPDRAELESKILDRIGKNSTSEQRRGLVVVGTQVLEQSLDIDFDVMITDLCPMDLLLQRIGRIHRHKHQRPAQASLPLCYVVMGKDGELEKGSKLIYGEWILNQTKKLLQKQNSPLKKIVLPTDIPTLVQCAYKEDNSVDGFEEYKLGQKNKKNKAKTYLLRTLEECDGTINGLLNNIDSNLSEAQASATVRDGAANVEVIVLAKNRGDICFLPWQEGGKPVLNNAIPSKEEERTIMRQRLRLPKAFCRADNVDTTIKELEKRTLESFGEWQTSPRLRYELILLLDANLETELCGYRLRYSQEYGLEYNRMEEDKK